MPFARIPATKPLAIAAAALLALAAFPSTTSFADRVDTVIALGATGTAAVDRPGDVATVGFVVSAGTGRNVVITVKRAAKSTLALDVRLVAPDGTVIDPAATSGGSVKASDKAWVAKLPDTAQSGLWRVEVRGADGSIGDFSCKVAAKELVTIGKTAATVPVNGVFVSELIAVGQNAAVTVTLKRAKGSTVTPRLQLLDPAGVALANGDFLGSTSTKSGSTSLKSYRLPTSGTYRLRVTGVDGKGGGFTYTVKAAPAKTKGALPIAQAPISVEAESGATAMLDGTGSQPVGTGQLTFSWVQISGPTVLLSNPRASAPTFTAPTFTGGTTSATLAFELSVAQGTTLSRSVAVSVEVGRRPVADAGTPQAVAPGSVTTLNGSRSTDRRGSGLLYTWTQDAADTSRVTLSSANAAQPTFTAPSAAGILHFTLTVDDGALVSGESRVVVAVGDPTRALADAGRNQLVRRMSTVTLSALATRTASGVLDVPLSWTQLAGPAVTLSDRTSPFPAFTAPKVDGTLVFELTADMQSTTRDQVVVSVRGSELNLVPVTTLTGPVDVPSGNANMDASTGSTDPNNDALTYRWAQLSGPALAMSNPEAAQTSVNLPAGNVTRTYVVIANDRLANGGPDTLTVRNAPYAGIPLAHAGNNSTTTPGVSVTLDGRASALTSGSGPLTYTWRQVSALDWYNVAASDPSFDASAAAPRVTIPTDLSSLTNRRTLTFSLVVNDGVSDSAPDFVTVSVAGLPTNGRPTVIVSTPTPNPIVGALVQLDALATDRDGDPLTVAWSQTAGAQLTLASPSPVTRTFTAPANGTYTFQAIASDGIEQSVPGTVTVVVDAAPIVAVQVSPGNGNAGQQVTVTSTGTSDPEGQPITYTWTQTAGTLVPPFDTSPFTVTTPSFSYTSPLDSTSFRLVVSDGRQNAPPVTATFTVGSPVTVTPTANKSSAGYGATVTLNANATGSGTISYTWRQLTSGANSGDPAVTFTTATTGSGAAAVSLTLPTPSSTPYGTNPSATIGVTATNGSTSSAEKTLTVTFFASLNNKGGDSTLGTNDRVYTIINNNCTSCHFGTSNSSSSVGSGGNASGYGLAGNNPNALRANSIGVAAIVSGKTRISAASASSSNGANSYFLDRLKGIATPRMPTGGSLSSAQIAFIEDWINQGALDN